MSTVGRFGVLVYPDRPFPTLTERFTWLERLGFDQIYLPDHSADPRSRLGPWFDSWPALAVAAVSTDRIRLGTLVANQILRPPAQLAKLASTMDHLTNGRFELGIGAGLFSWDHHSVGERPWPPKERMRRFLDYVAIVDGILRADDEMFSYRGRELWTSEIVTAPGCRQSPRVPIIVGGQSPSVLRAAARCADAWNTHGPPGASDEEVLAVTARQNKTIDQLAEEAGRDPSTIRRALTIFGPWDPRLGLHSYEEIFERFGQIGIVDFVLDWPGDPHLDEFVRVAEEVIPALRAF